MQTSEGGSEGGQGGEKVKRQQGGHGGKTSRGMTARQTLRLVGWLIRWEAVSLAGCIQGWQGVWLTDRISDQQGGLTRCLTGVKVGWLPLRMASWLSAHSLFIVCI